MVILYALAWGPVLAGIVLALIWWLASGRRHRLPGGSLNVLAAIAGLLGVCGVAVLRSATGLLFPFPTELLWWYQDYRFTVPLVFGLVAIILLAFPLRSRRGQGSAELTPRSPLRFVRGGWFAVPIVTLALVLALTIAAGAASQPDESSGRYMMYMVDLGGEAAMGTSIYGWFYSIPSLIVTGILLVEVAISLTLIARPAMVDDDGRDAQTRLTRSRNVLAIASGALLVHLGLILASLYGTSSLRSSVRMSDQVVSFWTNFAALGPTLLVASWIALALGIAHWVTVALSAIPSRRIRSGPS